MNGEQMQTFLDTWYRDRDEGPRDADSGVSEVMARVPHIRQRSRRWTFPVLYRRTRTPTITDTAEYHPTPIPAAYGHTPTVIGRTTSMLSPVKAITAGALAFAIGGVLLIAQPFDQQGGGVPGAATDELLAPVPVTGTAGDFAEGCRSTDYDGPYEDIGANASRFTCSTETGMPWTFSDPRLEGTATRINEESTIDLADGGEIWIASTAFSIENEGGTWRERPRTWLLPDGLLTYDWLPEEVYVFDGSGDYDGLVAVLRTASGDSEVRGFIIDARLFPPPPETASTD